MAIDGKVVVKSGRSLVKDFHRLMRKIDGMSSGQARLVGWDETDLKKGITLSIIPDGGLYKDAEFMFMIVCGTKYPEKAPNVYCKTRIYHPNIDTIDGDGEICLNMLDDDCWSASMTLEDVVQGVLFLMYNPNLDDPLCVIFDPGMEEEEFSDNVRQSLDGGLVEGYHFERNRVIRGKDGVAIQGVMLEPGQEMLASSESKQPATDGAKPTSAAAEFAEERKKVGSGEKPEEGEKGVTGLG